MESHCIGIISVIMVGCCRFLWMVNIDFLPRKCFPIYDENCRFTSLCEVDEIMWRQEMKNATIENDALEATCGKNRTDEARRNFLKKSLYVAYATPVVMSLLVEKANAGGSGDPGTPPIGTDPPPGWRP